MAPRLSSEKWEGRLCPLVASSRVVGTGTVAVC